MTAQNKTPKDTKEAINLMTESANKTIADARIAVDELSSFAVKAAENGQTILNSNQKLFQSGFDQWQNYTWTYAEFFLNAAQQTVDQSFAFRQSIDKLVVDSIKRNQALIEAEQSIVLNAADTYQAQVKATSERVAKSFSIPSLN